MNRSSVILSVLGALTLFFTGCASPQAQGPAAAVAQPATGDGPGHLIQPAPESKSFAGKKDVFQGAEYDPGVGGQSAATKQLHLRVGEVVEVFHGSLNLTSGERELAFYLPPEARSVVQLVVESKGFNRTYFLKAIGPGDTVGGVVERRWLDGSGYDPVDVAAEARIQSAIKATPYLISVVN